MNIHNFKQSCYKYVTPEDFNLNNKILDKVPPRKHEDFLGLLKQGANIGTANNALHISEPDIETLKTEYENLKISHNHHDEFMD